MTTGQFLAWGFSGTLGTGVLAILGWFIRRRRGSREKRNWNVVLNELKRARNDLGSVRARGVESQEFREWAARAIAGLRSVNSTDETRFVRTIQVGGDPLAQLVGVDPFDSLDAILAQAIARMDLQANSTGRGKHRRASEL